MKLVKHLILLSLLVCFIACRNHAKSSPRTAEGSMPAEVSAYLNGKIYTADRNDSFVQAMLIRDNRIEALGSTVEIRKLIGEKSVHTIDLEGSLVIPGIHDVHVHALESGSDNTHFALEAETGLAEDYLAEIERAAEDLPGEGWLVGYGHSLETLLEAEWEPRELIDSVVADRPVIIMEQTSHSMWVNSKALKLAKIDDSTPDPQGGVILRDNSGRANGLLLDNAGNLVMDLALASSPERLEADFQKLVQETLPKMASFGITSFCDARVYWGRDHHKVWLRLLEEERLTARVNLGLWAYPNLDDEQQLSRLKSLYRNNAEEVLKINQIKVYADGILHNTTAATIQEYSIDLFGLPGNRGLNYFTETRLTSYVKELEKVGFDFHIHAIGDRGVHEALNAVERGSDGSGRHRLTHVELVTDRDLPRFRKLNVTADCQVAGDFSQPARWKEIQKYLGIDSSYDFIPLKSLTEQGARLNLSSDWNVSTLNPFVGISNAVLRKPQNLTLKDALRAYTIGAAYTMRQEKHTGSLEPGKKADFVVLDRDIFLIEPAEISETKVTLTVFDGRVVYQE